MLDDFENLDDFTKGEFSTTAIVQSANSSITELTGIFDENYQDVFAGLNGQTAEGRKFCLQVQTTECEGLSHGDRLTIDGKNYQVVSMRPKHDGKLSHIILKQDFS